MRKNLWFMLNGIVSIAAAILLFTHFDSVPSAAQTNPSPPGPAGDTHSATHLAFVTFTETTNDKSSSHSTRFTATTNAYRLKANGQFDSQVSPQSLFSQPEPAMCNTDEAHASPNGRFLILQYNCEASLFIRLLDLTDPASQPVIFSRGYFLDWSPNGGWFLLRDIDADQVLLIAAGGAARRPLDLPFGTYGGSFAPDGQTIVYVASKGLGFGSEIGTLDLTGGSYVTVQKFPRQVVAYPHWSPDGGQMAYILMPDNNVPFTTGELWLADAAGKSTTLLDASVDAGHGYPPAWSPDGQTIAYIRRENPDSVAANHLANALHSNIYQVDVASLVNAVPPTVTINSSQATPVPPAPVPAAAAVQLTHFEAGLVYDIVWSPDGRQLAFTANDAVWTLEPGQTPVQVSQAGIARHPVWLVGP